MENKEELYNEEEMDLLNKLGIMAKEFKDAYSDTKNNDNEEEK